MKCPKCGCEDFIVTLNSNDTYTYQATIDDDGNIDLDQSLKDYVGDMDYWGNTECDECGANIDISTGEMLEPGVDLTPFTVLLMYPDSGNLEIFLSHVCESDAEAALSAARKEAAAANKGSLYPKDFTPVGIFNGHLVDLTNGRGCV